MTQALLVAAVVAAGVYVFRRALSDSGSRRRRIDVGAVSHGWIAEHRREDAPR